METEPPLKKFKYLDDNLNSILTNIDEYIQKIDSEENLKAVVCDKFEQPQKLIKVFVGHIKDVKDISRTILVLNEKVPLKELQHLKRVRRQDVILCPTNFFDYMSSIQDFIEKFVPELKDVFEYFKQVDVPLNPPKIEKHYQEAKQTWSCSFHPNKYLEKLTGNNFFSLYDVKNHRMYMKVVFEVARWYVINNNTISLDTTLNNINATIVVDPISKSIIALSSDNREVHPMQHSAMLAIDNVAKTQNGGAWMSSTDKNHSGIPQDILPYLKEKFPHLKFLSSENVIESKSVKKEGPYLCTGYYIYMLREPCVMCSMALVHARARRIFYSIDNGECGALKSKTKLQTIASLNHHFEVFTGFI